MQEGALQQQQQPWSALQRQPYAPEGVSPFSSSNQLPFQHSLQPSSWNEDSLLAIQHVDRPASANSALSNVRGAPSETNSSPVACRKAVFVSCSAAPCTYATELKLLAADSGS